MAKWKSVKLAIKKISSGVKSFGFLWGMRKLFLKLFPGKIKSKSKVYYFIKKRHTQALMSYLEKYLSVIRQYDYQESKEYIGASSNIWVLWWQGYEKAPDIVKTCIASIRRNAGHHPVVFLDQYNFKQYITLPDYVIDKFEKGHFAVAHLSDIIRTSILYEYGGIWMDSTIYMLHPLEEAIKNRVFYSLHIHDNFDLYKGRFGKWTTYFLASCRGNSIIGLLNKLLLEYWKQEETPIDYLFMDYFIAMIYWNVEPAKRIIDNIPITNTNIYKLFRILNESSNKLNELQDNGTYLYKLTYQKNFSDSVNGEGTVYHLLVHEGWDSRA